MQPFLKARLAYLLIGVIPLSITLEASAAEINCDSVVWRNKEECLDKDGGVKRKGVVDKKFKVFGTENLYVCDASIFPDLVSTHQYLPTLAVGKMFSLQHKWISF